jgi:hypothetical protein
MILRNAAPSTASLSRASPVSVDVSLDMDTADFPPPRRMLTSTPRRQPTQARTHETPVLSNTAEGSQPAMSYSLWCLCFVLSFLPCVAAWEQAFKLGLHFRL